VNAAIHELIPARRRGFTDLVVNGSFWIGAAIGAGGALIALDPRLMPPELGWRVAFGIGGVLGLGVLVLRHWIPESPRWLMTHGQPEAAEQVVRGIEARVAAEVGPLPPVPPNRLRLRTDIRSWFGAGMVALVTRYRRRTVVGVVLMASQAFCYNAVFFTYALILTRFYGVAAGRVGLFILPFAVSNFLGPLLLGRLFDVVGRRVMITGTYAASGLLMALTGALFAYGGLSAVGQTIAWTVFFFFASPAASSAYLTVGENFPLEVRAVAIALFYAFGTLVGGLAGPALFGALIEGGSRGALMWGYELGAGLMLVAAVVAWGLGIAAERRPLEEVASPLATAVD
jgi:MFS family permease